MEFHCISTSVTTNPKIESVMSSLSNFDLMDGLGSKNSRCLVNFSNDDNYDPIYKLIIWNNFLKGRINSIQVWAERI